MPSLGVSVRAGLWMAASMVSEMDTKGATIVAGPGEAGLRAAIVAAQEGDTVLLANSVKLEATVLVDKGLTIRFNQQNVWYNLIHGDFEG